MLHLQGYLRFVEWFFQLYRIQNATIQGFRHTAGHIVHLELFIQRIKEGIRNRRRTRDTAARSHKNISGN